MLHGTETIDQELTNECNNLKQFLETNYLVLISRICKLQELNAIVHGLFDVKEGLGGFRYFTAMFGGVEIIREQAYLNGDNVAQTTIGQPIRLFGKSFDNFDTGRWTIIHELGHKFDYQSLFVTELNSNDSGIWETLKLTNNLLNVALGSPFLSDQWEHVGTRKIDKKIEKDNIPVTVADGNFKKLILIAENRDIIIKQCIIQFDDDSRQIVNLRKKIEKDTASPEIDLTGGGEHTIQSFTITYEASKKKGKVKLYGFR